MSTVCRLALLFSLVVHSSVHAQPWKALFDGQSLDGWVTTDRQPADAPAWEVRDGMLHLDRSKGPGGNLLTDQDYGNFELIFEWKVAPGANNGIKYRVRKFDERTLGLEYQIIDDGELSNLKPDHRTASIYDIYDAKEHSYLRPAGEFNRGRIVVRNQHLQHWLNGHLIAEAEVGSQLWRERIADSKFSDIEGFGANHFGRIMITDHQDEIWFRNIFIRELPLAYSASTSASKSFLRPCPQTNTRPRRVLFRRLARRR